MAIRRRSRRTNRLIRLAQTPHLLVVLIVVGGASVFFVGAWLVRRGSGLEVGGGRCAVLMVAWRLLGFTGSLDCVQISLLLRCGVCLGVG